MTNEDICLPFDLVIILRAVQGGRYFTQVFARRGERWRGRGRVLTSPHQAQTSWGNTVGSTGSNEQNYCNNVYRMYVQNMQKKDVKTGENYGITQLYYEKRGDGKRDEWFRYVVQKINAKRCKSEAKSDKGGEILWKRERDQCVATLWQMKIKAEQPTLKANQIIAEHYR